MPRGNSEVKQAVIDKINAKKLVKRKAKKNKRAKRKA